MNTPVKIHIIGAGLAGSEAAFQLAELGIEVHLHEMRPDVLTPAHKSADAAELVCTNSLKSQAPTSGPGILKREMRSLNSLILRQADAHSVPGGEALTVDREKFSASVTRVLEEHPRIHRHSGLITKPFEDAPTLIATGPLTAEPLAHWLVQATGEKDLYFYDAIAPILDASSINMDIAWEANRYDKGDEAAYINCPFTREEYERFIAELDAAEKVPPAAFEKEIFFQGCQPIEAIAATGPETLRFGPMKPAGLDNPRTGRWPYAVVQLRPENRAKTAYNMVGFQTKLKYPEQKRVFRLIPGLENALFLRMGSIHRNTYVCGPRVLHPDLSLKGHPLVYLAGQITGVEGYLESAAVGLLAGRFASQRLLGRPHEAPPANTALGALLRHITAGNAKNYQPGNMNFGLFDPAYFDGVSGQKRDVARTRIAEQSSVHMKEWSEQVWTNYDLKQNTPGATTAQDLPTRSV